MSTKCYHHKCSWSGDSDDLFDHFECSHRRQLVELNDIETDELKFGIDEMKRNTFLIVANDGLYWFIMRRPADAQHPIDINMGLFPVAGTKPLEYHMRFGEDGYDTLMCYGNFDADKPYEGIDTDTLPIEVNELFLDPFDELKDKVARLILQPYDADIIGASLELGPDNVNWLNEDNVNENDDLIEKYTCPVCFNPMKEDIFLCENKHLLCKTCFNTIQKKEGHRMKCPICKGGYSNNVHDEEVEFEAKFVAHPESDAYKMLNDVPV